LANVGDWSPEVYVFLIFWNHFDIFLNKNLYLSTRQAGLNFSNFFEELPIVVKNSHLINVLLAELSLFSHGKKTNTVLELGTKRALERLFLIL
jgi:hypothetical protein